MLQPATVHLQWLERGINGIQPARLRLLPLCVQHAPDIQHGGAVWRISQQGAPDIVQACGQRCQAAARQQPGRWGPKVGGGRKERGGSRLGAVLLVLAPLVVVVRSRAGNSSVRFHPHPHSSRHASKLCNPKPSPHPKYALCRVCRTTPSKKSMLQAVSQQKQRRCRSVQTPEHCPAAVGRRLVAGGERAQRLAGHGSNWSKAKSRPEKVQPRATLLLPCS